jgi:hypothetical protein
MSFYLKTVERLIGFLGQAENSGQGANLDKILDADLRRQMLRRLGERRGLDPWEKIAAFTGDEWFPSRLPFDRLKVRREGESGMLKC